MKMNTVNALLHTWHEQISEERNSLLREIKRSVKLWMMLKWMMTEDVDHG